MTAADPKPRARRRSGGTSTLSCVLEERECVVCGRAAENAHHVLPKSHGGDDEPDACLSICGSGTMRCHGAEHGSPYTDTSGHRWTTEEVRRSLGRAVLARPRKLAYLIGRLGEDGTRALLERRYRLTVVEIEDAWPAW